MSSNLTPTATFPAGRTLFPANGRSALFNTLPEGRIKGERAKPLRGPLPHPLLLPGRQAELRVRPAGAVNQRVAAALPLFREPVTNALDDARARYLDAAAALWKRAARRPKFATAFDFEFGGSADAEQTRNLLAQATPIGK